MQTQTQTKNTDKAMKEKPIYDWRRVQAKVCPKCGNKYDLKDEKTHCQRVAFGDICGTEMVVQEVHAIADQFGNLRQSIIGM